MQNKRIEILLIEEDQARANLVEEMLGSKARPFALHRVSRLDEGLETLKGRSFDCIVVDLAGSGDPEGEAAAAVGGAPEHVPVVVLAESEQAGLQALQQGAQDYLVREELGAALLTRSLDYAIQRRQAEQALTLSEQKFHNVFNAAPILIFLTTFTDGRIIDINVAALNTLGYRRDELVGRTVYQSNIWRDPAMRENLVRELRGERPVRDREVHYFSKSGESFVGLLSAEIIEFDSECCILSLVKDVTEEKRADQALERAKEEWERTFDSVPDLIAIMDAKQRILRVNRAMAERVGIPAEQCAGLPCYKVIHGTLMPAQSCPHLHTEADGQEHRAEVYEPHRGVYFLVSTTPLNAPDGSIIGTVHVARDITETKRAEEKIKLLNAELTQRAAELEAANKDLESFSYTAAHDLRQPLNVINGYCQAIEIMHGDELSPESLDFLREINQGVLRMSKLIDSLLDFSRTGRGEIRRERVDLSTLAREVAAELRKGEPGRNASFRIEDGIVAEGDPDLLRIVLDNLLGNAWKYTAAKQGALIEFGAGEVGGATACFVRDNGPGFDMADAEQLFEPFQRLAGAEAEGGFGIGLATVHRIILRHGGKVWGEGAPGQGATFYFTLSR